MTTGPPVEPALEDVVADAAATAGFPLRSPRPGIWLAPLGRVEAVDVARLARELRARYALSVAPVPPTSTRSSNGRHARSRRVFTRGRAVAS